MRLSDCFAVIHRTTAPRLLCGRHCVLSDLATITRSCNQRRMSSHKESNGIESHVDLSDGQSVELVDELRDEDTTSKDGGAKGKRKNSSLTKSSRTEHSVLNRTEFEHQQFARITKFEPNERLGLETNRVRAGLRSVRFGS
ncbi:hypothetical protein R6Q59_035106 [Mikania micrantha]